VFNTVFPVLAEALAFHDSARPREPTQVWLDEVRKGTLIMLYRLLFVLYAEDRDLLPNKNGAYTAYSLSNLRREIAEARHLTRPVSGIQPVYWVRVKAIFATIGSGEDILGVPPYNGGLFDADAAPILDRVELPDAIVSDIIFALSHVQDDRGAKYVNYRDLSVQQLGSVYERILEFGLRTDDTGRIIIDRDDDERHDTGSYYTPDALVSLIIDRTVGPLLKTKAEAFAQAAKTLAGDRRPTADRVAQLARLDPACAYLDLKICDPAMGSGHFLVSLVDWLATRVLEALAEAPGTVTWAEYASPLLARVAGVRTRILAEAKTHGWPISPEQLDDRRVIRRMILKRVVFGVDKNPFAVELAKVSLWLHTFTAGAPLSFLDHHLRCGDSIIGAWVRPTLDAVAAGGGLLFGKEVARVENIASRMTEIEAITDNDIAEVRASSDAFDAVADATRQLNAFFSLMAARHALDVDLDPKLRAPRHTPEQLRKAGAAARQIATAEKQQRLYDRAAAFKAVLARQYGDPLEIAAGDIVIPSPLDDAEFLLPGDIAEAEERRRRAAALVSEARALSDREGFLHWEIAFPNVWRRLGETVPEGGFDALVGNPPYVRQEKLASIKPALAANYRTYAGMADLYLYFFEQGLRLVKPGGRVGYVVTNKWLKAGYAEELRAMLIDPERAEAEIVIDFGHARAFFPDADVFPNVTVFRKPDTRSATEDFTVSVPSRETLPDEHLPDSVAAASFALSRAALGKEGWTLEPKPVMELLAKIRGTGATLAEYVGAKPLYGIKTGLNEAFLIDTQTREQLVAADPTSREVIRPYLRGQDIQRWTVSDSDLYIILLKSSSDFSWPWSGASDEATAEQLFAAAYPSIYRHMKRLESVPGQEPGDTKGLRHRADQGRFWWELRPCAYYETFRLPKIFYQVIQFYPSYSLDRSGIYSNDKTFFIPSSDQKLLAVLNSPLLWWHNWRYLPHMKDEALTTLGVLMEKLPIASLPETEAADSAADRLIAIKLERRDSANAIQDWLRVEFGIERPGRGLNNPHTLDLIGFYNEVRAALPRRRDLSVAEIARLKREYGTTIEPARQAAAEAARLECRLSDLVNQAYGLTPEEIRLMWETAPPRMPILSPFTT
jgi:hypothetical protein